MGKGVLYKTMLKNNPNRIIIAKVALRDSETEMAKSFVVLQTVRTVVETKKALDYYEQEGYEDVVAIPHLEEGNSELQGYPPELVAKMFRVLYHA